MWSWAVISKFRGGYSYATSPACRTGDTLIFKTVALTQTSRVRARVRVALTQGFTAITPGQMPNVRQSELWRRLHGIAAGKNAAFDNANWPTLK